MYSVVVKHASEHVRAHEQKCSHMVAHVTHMITQQLELAKRLRHPQPTHTYLPALIAIRRVICLGGGSGLQNWWRRAGGRQNLGLAETCFFALRGPGQVLGRRVT